MARTPGSAHPDPLDDDPQLGITLGPRRPTRRIDLPRLRQKVRRRGDRQHRADRLNPVLVSVSVDEPHHHFTRRRLDHHGLIVQHPIADVFVAFFRQDVRRVPGLGQAWSEPSTRPTARELRDGGRRLLDVDALIGHLLHVLLSEAVADEFPLTVERGACDWFAGLNGAAVDRKHRGDPQPIEDLQHAPEADTVAVFVPRPVGDVGHR